jgi:hypothetical protein
MFVGHVLIMHHKRTATPLMKEVLTVARLVAPMLFLAMASGVIAAGRW